MTQGMETSSAMIVEAQVAKTTPCSTVRRGVKMEVATEPSRDTPRSIANARARCSSLLNFVSMAYIDN